MSNSLIQQESFEGLCSLSLKELDQVMRRGSPPAYEDLAGWEFRGYNTHPMAELIRVRKFKKGFRRDPGRPERLQGYNVRIEQNGLLNPWIARMRHGEPIREFPYTVYPVRPEHKDSHYLNSLMLNYDIEGKLPVDPSRGLRDYLVQVSPDNRDLLLGRAFYALGPLRVPLGFFVLERYNEAL